MPKFTYTILKNNGQKEQGTVTASSLSAASHQLKEQGLAPIELVETKVAWNPLAFLMSLRSIPLGEKLVFVENLQLLLKSGVPVSRAMQILAKQTKNRRFITVLSALQHGVESGRQLNEVMSEYPKVFSDIFVNMIKVGEMSGNLEESLLQLSIQLEREADLRSRVRGAMMYPSVILIAMITIGVLMAVFVLPKLTATFKDFGGELPTATKVVMAISDFMSGHAILVLIALVLAGPAFMALLRTDAGKAALYRLSLVVPGIGPLTVKINIARFTRVLSSLLKSGIPIVESLSVAGKSIPNTLYQEAIALSAERVKVGKPLTEVLAEHERLFPFLIVQMLQVGEETGTLETILEQIATHLEAQIDSTLKNMSSIIEPLLLLIIGGAVGALAYALIIPIYNIGTNIK